MMKVTTFLNRFLAFVLLIFGWTRVAVARIFPSSGPPPGPSTVKVFALSESAWLELRSGQDVSNQEKSAPKSTDDQKGSSKKGDDSNAPAKNNGEKKDQAKGAACDKAGSQGEENKGQSPDADKAKDSPKPGECEKGPGGGDGDMGGTGG